VVEPPVADPFVPAGMPAPPLNRTVLGDPVD
jgi:hypothetical protein